MNEVEKFQDQREKNVIEISNSEALQKAGVAFVNLTAPFKYSYNFSWLGRPIIAYPQDMIAMQEIIWEVKPDLVIETGVAHGGSIIYYASLLELIGGDGIVVGIDVDIRKYNRDLIESHAMYKRIRLIEGSSIDPEVMKKVNEVAASRKRILVCLDSNHTHQHVIEELNLYTSLVSVGSYCVVFDTIIEEMPIDYDWKDRPWGKGNNPKTAVREFLKGNKNFEIDSRQNKLLVTVAPDGYLKRVK